MNYEKVEQPKLAQHDASCLDLAFCMDCTGSMGSYIENARNSIRHIVEEIVASEKSDVKLALVEYRDHPPQDDTFVTRVHDFTSSIKEMKIWLDNCKADGGGDSPEAVADGLHDTLKLSWRKKSTKICVLISDAPPHGLAQSGDTMPNGCLCKIDPINVVNQMAEKGITLYSVGCEPALLPYKDFFACIAYKTGGQYVPLRNANLLSKVIIGGAQEEISLEKLMEEVQQEVNEQVRNGIVDESALTEALHSKLFSKGVKAKNLKYNDASLERASENAVLFSKMTKLSSISAALETNHLSKLEYSSIDSGVEFHVSATSKKSGGILRNLYDSTIGKWYSKSKASAEPVASAVPKTSILPSPVYSSSSASAACSPEADSYTVTEEVINKEQTERLVQKALHRNKNLS